MSGRPRHDLAEAPIDFDRAGLVADEKKPGAIFVEATRVWVTNLADHPFRIEWLHFEPDSPVTGPLRHGPHIGFRVGSVEAIREALRGPATRPNR